MLTQSAVEINMRGMCPI